MASLYHDDPGHGQGGPGQDQQRSQYHYNYSYGPGRGSAPPDGRKPPKDSGGWGEWAAIAALFMVPFGWFTKVIAAIWALNKLGSMDKGQKARFRREASQAAQRAADYARDTVADLIGQAQAQSQARPQPQKQAKAQPSGWSVRDVPENRKKARRGKAGGTGLIIGGGVTSAIFTLGTMVTLFQYLDDYPIGAISEDLIAVAACLMFLAGGLAMLFSGIGINRRGERYVNYLAYIGANREVSLAHMAASFDVPVGRLCKDLRRMLARGILPTGYLDLAEGKLFLTEMGYRQPQPKAAPQESAQQAAGREEDILRQIRQVNDDIPDKVMSAKIRRIEEITGKILAYQKSHPNREGQLRTFLGYYLPTTLKILRAYAQLDAQGIEGENISAAKGRIEGMMDQVVSGFEKQLDRLFQDDAMDITSDVEVLENMLKKDGLSGGMTMTM